MIKQYCDRCNCLLDYDSLYPDKMYYNNGSDEHICKDCITPEEKEDADIYGWIR